MGILADWQIDRDVKIEPFHNEQCAKGVVSFGLSSYGYDMRLGYKFKVFSDAYAGEIDPKNFDPKNFVEIDLTPKRCWNSPPCRDRIDCLCISCRENESIPNYIRIPPNSFALGESLETFEIPRDVLAVCVGKSSYARCGVIINVTPLEPEWRGKVTIEISNTTPLPCRVYAGEGIAQVLFFRTDGKSEWCENLLTHDYLGGGKATGTMYPDIVDETLDNLRTRTSCRVSYADRKGRYQDQKGLTLPFVQGGRDERHDVDDPADNKPLRRGDVPPETDDGIPTAWGDV